MQKNPFSDEIQAAFLQLRNRIASSDSYRRYALLKKTAMEKPENAALLRRYHELQTELNQMPEGQEPDEAVCRDFEKLNMIVFEDEQLREYMMSRMKLEMQLGRLAEALLKMTDDVIDIE